MFISLRKGAQFIKKNPSLLLSLILIVVIPSLVFFVVSFLSKSFQTHIDLTLQKQAMMVQGVLSPYVFEHYSQPEILQEKVEYLAETNPELSKLIVLLPVEGDNFKIIASRSSEEQEEEISKTSLTLAWHKNQSIAFLGREEGVRFWNIVSPFYDNTGEKVGLISISLSLGEIDNLVTNELKKAYIFVLVSIVLILILVIHHTRLFQYVSLFKRLREADKAKDSFMNMAVHELRSPLVNISYHVLALKEEILPSLNQEEKIYLSGIEISIKRLNDLISDMLNVIRIEQGRVSFEPEDISPSKIILEIIEELKSKAIQNDLKIKFIESEERNGKIRVNSNRLQQILYNLIDNAIKYTKKGEVTVILKEDHKKGKVYITVADTGMGVSAEEQKLLFQRFYRVKTRETADIQGTGLGLWIVKQLCSRMKGKILLESIKGVGSKFIIIFPLVK